MLGSMSVRMNTNDLLKSASHLLNSRFKNLLNRPKKKAISKVSNRPVNNLKNKYLCSLEMKL